MSGLPEEALNLITALVDEPGLNAGRRCDDIRVAEFASERFRRVRLPSPRRPLEEEVWDVDSKLVVFCSFTILCLAGVVYWSNS